MKHTEIEERAKEEKHLENAESISLCLETVCVLKQLSVVPNVAALLNKWRRELYFIVWNMEDRYNFGEVIEASLCRVDLKEPGNREFRV